MEKNGKKWLWFQRHLSFDCAGGDDIGRSLMVATDKVANIFLLSGRTACRWKYDSYDSLIRDIAPLSLSDPSEILYNPHSMDFFFYLEKSEVHTAWLLTLSGL